ncbi:zf-TFIIB domain-containing protein [Sporolactobacillus vineae]|uniref:TFIIB-type zinc ribbon-containing protein n=1 Tax=Sporolactobacillus vineae TaxID=444463 RepID=UPI0002FFB335|nr:zf-TFIIB domain-containing protein [Sporolactobacillus vineae]
MLCPVCDDVRMKEVEKGSVVVDICPNCKGVWLDRGELDKITRVVRQEKEWTGSRYDSHDDEDVYDRKGRYGERQDHDRHQDYGHRKKKKSPLDFLGDLFD